MEHVSFIIILMQFICLNYDVFFTKLHLNFVCASILRFIFDFEFWEPHPSRETGAHKPLF